MKVTAIHTSPVAPGSPDLITLLQGYISDLPSHSILVVSSKIVSICEGRTVPDDQAEREDLVRQESDYYRTTTSNPYNFAITVKDDVLVGSAGIDLSNGDGHYVLWPSDPQASANSLRQHFSRPGRPIGIIISDSHSTPFRRGATGFGLAHSGFQALVPYVGRSDIFGRPFKSEVANVLDGLAAGAGAVMGEGAEQTPIALIENVPFVHFQNRDPTPSELGEIRVAMKDDVYREAFERMDWDKRPPAT